jgi:hypothetical protein
MELAHLNIVSESVKIGSVKYADQRKSRLQRLHTLAEKTLGFGQLSTLGRPIEI